jgi:hypothetical protein
MTRHSIRLALAGAVLAAACGIPAAQAADYQYCRNYARTAMDQVRQAESNPACSNRIHDPDRWTINYQHHFQWCLDAPPWQVQHEWDARSRFLWHCMRGM